MMIDRVDDSENGARSVDEGPQAGSVFYLVLWWSLLPGSSCLESWNVRVDNEHGGR